MAQGLSTELGALRKGHSRYVLAFCFHFEIQYSFSFPKRIPFWKKHPIFFNPIPCACESVFSTRPYPKMGLLTQGLLKQSTHSPGHRDWCRNGHVTQMEPVRLNETLQGLYSERYHIFRCASTWENIALTLLIVISL